MRVTIPYLYELTPMDSVEIEDVCLRMAAIKISFEGSEEVVTNLFHKVGNTVASMATKGGEKRKSQEI